MNTADALRELAEKVDRFESARRCLQTAESDLREALGAAGPVGQALAPLYFDRGPAPWSTGPRFPTPPARLPETEAERFEAFVASIDPDPIAEAFELLDEDDAPSEVDEPAPQVDEPAPKVDEPAPKVDVLADPVVAEALVETAALVTPQPAPDAAEPPWLARLQDDADPAQRPDPEPATVEAPSTAANPPELPDGSIDLDQPITLNQFAKLLGLNPNTVYEAEKLAALPPKSLIRVPELSKPKVIPRLALKGWRPTRALDRIRELLGETA